MIQRSCNSIAKRSIQSRRCMFYDGSQKITRQQQTPLSFPYLLSARVSSTTATQRSGLAASATAATNAVKNAAANTNINTATSSVSSARQILQRAFSQDAIRRALPIIGNGAYMALASGFLATDMFQLRLMLVGGYTGLVAFHSLHPKPLQIPLRWSMLFVVVNAGAVMMLFMDRWIGDVLLSDEEMALYEKHFKDDSGLTTGQFYYLLQMATTEEIPDGNILTKEGRVSPNLFFVEKGQAKTYHHGAFAAYIDEGGFVNDVAFQQQKEDEEEDELDGIISMINNINPNKPTMGGIGAYGTVVTHGDCKVLVWNQTELKDFLKKRPDMDRNMKYTLSRHLVNSLIKQRAVRRLTTPERKELRRIETSTCWP